MNLSRCNFGTRGKALVLGAMAVGAVALCAQPAEARGWYGGWGWHSWGPTVGIGIGFYPGYVYAPPVYYAPAPVYYAPPTYYAPSYYSSSSYSYSTSSVRRTVHHRSHKTTTTQTQSCAPTQTASNY